jgi:clan AA aspartic protease (TIGR02281 family)
MAADFHRTMDDLATGKETDLLLGTDAHVETLVALTDSFQHDLGFALARQQTKQHDAGVRKKRIGEAIASEARLVAGPTAADARKKDQAAAQLKAVRDQIRHLRVEADREEKARKVQIEETSALREAFVKCVAVLQKTVDQGKRFHEEPAVDGGAKGPTDHNLKAAATPVPSPVTAPQREFLDNAEKAIETETIPLEPDKTVYWVTTTLNGKPGQRMVIDPDAETVRIPARSAEALGIAKDEQEPEVQVTTSDGTTLAARPSRIASVEIGPFTVNNVECLIMPDGYEAPPVLGASVLDQFLSTLDLDAAKLTLVKVDVKPVYSRTTPRTGAGAGAQAKKR